MSLSARLEMPTAKRIRNVLAILGLLGATGYLAYSVSLDAAIGARQVVALAKRSLSS